MNHTKITKRFAVVTVLCAGLFTASSASADPNMTVDEPRGDVELDVDAGEQIDDELGDTQASYGYGYYGYDDYRRGYRRGYHRGYRRGYGPRYRRGYRYGYGPRYRRGYRRGYGDPRGGCGYYSWYCHERSDLGVTDLTFFDLGDKLGAEATIFGIDGEATVNVELEANADLRSSCGAYQLADEALEIASQATSELERVELADDALGIAFETDATGTSAQDLVDCPGDQLAVEDVEFLDARVDIEQDGVALTLLCTFLTPTIDGEVAPENVECTVL